MIPKRVIALVLFSALFSAPYSFAQLRWSKLVIPDTISDYALGSDGTLYIVTGYYRPTHEVFASHDLGTTWNHIYSGTCRGITCDSFGQVFIMNSGIIHSSDEGAHWQPIAALPSGFASDMGCFIQCSNSALYFGGGYSTEIARTTDIGGSWIVLNSLSAMILDGAGLFCGPFDRVLLGLTYESSWILLDSLHVLHDTASPLILADNSPPARVLFGMDGFIFMDWLGGYFRLKPVSLHWESYDTTSSPNAKYFPLASINSATLISVDDSGTYVSKDHGSLWSRIGNGIPTSWSAQIAFDQKGNGYALTDFGLFITSYYAAVNEAPQIRPNLSIFPNPFSQSTHITFTTEATGYAEVSIVNLLGTEVAHLFSGTLGAGEHSFEWSAAKSGSPRGMYECAVRTGGRVETLPIVLGP